jgi:beta-glucosidase/6-phospho-beta-glucosidase/beta-galactosidase
LLSHARAVETFRKNKYPGQIGIILDYKWVYPDNASSAEDLELSQLDRDNVLGIYADPIFGTGDFPESVKAFYGDFMPVLSAEDQSALRGSADFIGLNTYGGRAVNRSAYSTTLADYHAGDFITERYSYCPCASGTPKTHVENYTFECGADSTSWLWIKPDAMYQYLNYFKTNYGNPKVYVTEFGVDVKGESDMEIATALQDDFRQNYYQIYMMQIAKAKNEGVNVKGVFAWTMLDNFEWHDGTNFRFGITYVDYNSDKLTRYPKKSAIWWRGLIASMSSTTVTV